jgi:hypothetical protein
MVSIPDRKFDLCSVPFDGLGVVGLEGIGVTDRETMPFSFASLDSLMGHISGESGKLEDKYRGAYFLKVPIS